MLLASSDDDEPMLMRQKMSIRIHLYSRIPVPRTLRRETKNSPHVKESGFRNPRNFCIWNPESWKFLLLESGILGLGIRNTGVGIRNPTNNSNPESNSTEIDLESSNWNPESTGWNPESKSVLDSVTWGEKTVNLRPGSIFVSLCK